MAQFVLDKGPSDHRPYIQDFEYTSGRAGRFRVVTANVHHSTEADEAWAHIRDIEMFTPDIYLMQEVKPKQKLEKFFTKKLGMGFAYETPEFAVAWNVDRFRLVRSRKVLMSPTEYWTLNYALVVLMVDIVTGNRVLFMTYHTPAHVEAPKHKTWAKVTKAYREALAKMGRIVRSREKAGRIDAYCFAGDDNDDPTKGYQPPDDWGIGMNYPLTEVLAPSPTHGHVKKGRRIDDFRVRGLRPV